MDFPNLFNPPEAKTPAEAKAMTLQLFSAMPPDRFFEHMNNLREMAQRNGREDEREELVCRLLASGMPVEEIAVVLSLRTDAVRIIEQNNAAIKIPEYTKKLKERRRRREKQANATCKTDG